MHSSSSAGMLHDRAAHRCTGCCMAATASSVAMSPDAIPTAAIVTVVAAIAATAADAGQVRQQLLE